MRPPFQEIKFQKLTLRQKHKWASLLLKEGNLLLYQDVAKWLFLPPLEGEVEALTSRYHHHLKEAGISVKEDLFLTTTLDKQSNEPFLPISIYLDHLRSAHNVGSIIRTTESMRLGSIHFSKETPPPSHSQVKRAAMGTDTLVSLHLNTPLQELRRPFIALETTKESSSLFDFTFPESFTLFLGNEERGVSDRLLKEADAIVSIPLVGSKNSLNVASAFAIVAYEIRRQQSKSLPLRQSTTDR